MSKKTPARFTKGQTVYQISYRFTENMDKRLAFVVCVSRIVDSCGAKRVTFYDRGNDGVYRRSHPADSTHLFTTHAEAITALKAHAEQQALYPKNYTVIVDEREHSDAEGVLALAAELKASI